MATRRYPSLPAFRLGSDLSSSGSLLITRTAVDWEGETIASSLFNSDYIPVTLTNDARTRIEFMLLDVSTIASLTTTGATIYKRGLPFTATGVDATDITEDTDKKLAWTQGETVVLIGTNQPWMYGQLANRKNAETIEGLWTFTTAQRPKLSSDADASADAEFITRGQLNRTALGTTSSDRLTVAGTAGETLVAGNLVYFKASDSRWWKADADSAASSDDVVLGIAQGAGVAGGAITTGVLLRGLDQNQSGLASGSTYYVSATAGALSATPGSNNVSVGVAASATSILLVPRFDSFITPAVKALVEAITADAAEINKLDGYTGTTANLNEMAAIVDATDITGAELETLSAGVNSNADPEHTHPSLKPTFSSTSEWGLNTSGSPVFTVGCVHVPAGTTQIVTGVGVGGDTDTFFGALFYSKGGGFFTQDVENYIDLSFGENPDAFCGIISIGGVIITSSDDGGVAEIVKEGTGKYTISGTGLTNGTFCMLGFDNTTGYLLIWDTSTTIHRYSGYAGTTLTYVDEVTMPVAIVNTGGLGTYPSFCFDDTNNYYIYPDFTNSVIRRVNAAGATVDTFDYTTVLGTGRPYGVLIHNGTVYMAVPAIATTAPGITEVSKKLVVTFVPTTLTV